MIYKPFLSLFYAILCLELGVNYRVCLIIVIQFDYVRRVNSRKQKVPQREEGQRQRHHHAAHRQNIPRLQLRRIARAEVHITLTQYRQPHQTQIYSSGVAEHQKD